MSCLGCCGGGDMNGSCMSCFGIGDIEVCSVCVGRGCMTCLE